MCPACLATAALWIAGSAPAGLATFYTIKAYQKQKNPEAGSDSDNEQHHTKS